MPFTVSCSLKRSIWITGYRSSFAPIPFLCASLMQPTTSSSGTVLTAAP